MAGITRAVIQLPGDFSTSFPALAARIPGCVHNKVSDLLAFRRDDHAVIVEGDQLIVMGIADISTARSFAAWFNGMLDSLKQG